MRIRALALLPLVLILAQQVWGKTDSQEKTFGDRTVEAEIQAQTREFYGKDTARVYLLTSKDVLGADGSCGTELEGSMVGSNLVRVVAFACTARGRYSAEFYLRDGKLLFVYESLEYFAESAPEGAWQNFKHIPTWERRLYFKDGVVAYGSSIGKGAPDPGADGRKIQDVATRLAGLLATRPQVSTPQHH
jgi:hypothetical protein